MIRALVVATAAAMLATPLLGPAADAEERFDASFFRAGGNAWWIQVEADADRPIASVATSIDGGDWKPLRLRDWGAWAESHHAPDGSFVRFRATSGDGAIDVSGCYRWTNAEATACPGESDAAPFEATFRTDGGNEWWVSVDVAANRPLAGVDARVLDEGEAWRALRLRDWGAWAESFHVPDGSLVAFRARSVGGEENVSGAFVWPEGAPAANAPPPPPGEPAPPVVNGSRRLVALGDTGTGARAAANVELALADNASGMLGLGDYYYWDPPEDWLRAFAPLLERHAHLVRGNHDEPSRLAPHFENGTAWSRNVSDARVVGIDSTRTMAEGTAQHAWARDALCQAREPLRVLLAHHPWWLGPEAHHPGSEFPAAASTMDRLVRACGVDLVLAAHEHNYQRAVFGNVSYVIVGTGGMSLYPVAGSPVETVASAATYGRLLLDLNESGYRGWFRTLQNLTLDVFEGGANATRPPPPPPPPLDFRHRGGNGWWVEVDVAPHPVAVEAQDTGGVWHALSFRDWGNWAGSFRIEPGHEVQFRARAGSGGAWNESCWFSHPEGASRCGSAPPPFDAEFDDVAGNEWWLQVDVRANADVAAVHAKIDGGAWKPLELKDWGDWAASHHAPTGSVVEFRATSAAGETDVSRGYAWPPP